jgi:hypothetical protein
MFATPQVHPAAAAAAAASALAGPSSSSIPGTAGEDAAATLKSKAAIKAAQASAIAGAQVVPSKKKGSSAQVSRKKRLRDEAGKEKAMEREKRTVERVKGREEKKVSARSVRVRVRVLISHAEVTSGQGARSTEGCLRFRQSEIEPSRRGTRWLSGRSRAVQANQELEPKQRSLTNWKDYPLNESGPRPGSTRTQSM